MAASAAASLVSTLVDAKRLSSFSSNKQKLSLPHCVSLPSLPLRAYKCGRFAKSVIPMATGESLSTMESTSEAETELPEALKSIQEVWERLDDKYAIASLGVAGIIALWGSTGLITAIDRLPLVPGVLELVGIGYTGWFAYQNLFFKPDRVALLTKIKCTLDDVIGSS